MRIQRVTRAKENFMKNGKTGEEDTVVKANEGEMRVWLGLHYLRNLVGDVAAVVCFAGGLGYAALRVPTHEVSRKVSSL
ncbi:hypothetical protein FIBSPDRAFT_391184 [Athelia psychrophila]|uniref:Uncharacterized protein n=1 Tax=Athelia psychrophila TaxID=1759441 RepID=A0A167V5E9_9AGAM|nr:hypothetical protein FIBSPDRAFT_391184 [Fibularhizoctonia sp. CBS 109695]